MFIPYKNYSQSIRTIKNLIEESPQNWLLEYEIHSLRHFSANSPSINMYASAAHRHTCKAPPAHVCTFRDTPSLKLICRLVAGPEGWPTPRGIKA